MSIRRWFYSRGIRWFTINDGDRDGKGHLWREGRLITYLFEGSDSDDSYRTRAEIGFSWCHRPRLSAAISVEVGSGDSDKGLQFHLDVLGVRYWLAIESDLVRRLCERVLPYRIAEYQGRQLKISQAREIRAYIVEGYAHWSIWQPTMEWSSKTPWWRSGGFFVADALLGRATYKKEDAGEPATALASFPEGSYQLTLQREVATWKRPRWPWARVREYVDIRCENPPQFRGKGENSYDLDDDGIYGMGSDGHSYEHAVAAYIEAVLKNREKYGHVEKSDQAVFA